MKRRIVVALAVLVVGALVGIYAVGSRLMAPTPSVVGELPDDLRGESVEIPSASGSRLRGWFLPGEEGKGAIVLMHGMHGSRRAMLGRARFLNRAGYSVLLFDFQANGESPGEHQTFGYLESRDARAAVDYARERVPGAGVGVVGTSLGGAAAVLADPPLPVDALVIEAVYPTVEEAVADRLALRLGSWASVLGPALTVQVRPRLGFSTDVLRPIDRVGSIDAPKLFMAGTEDRHTRFEEATAIYDAAKAPKEFWAIEGASHVDLHVFVGAEYERRVLAFFDTNLNRR